MNEALKCTYSNCQKLQTGHGEFCEKHYPKRSRTQADQKQVNIQNHLADLVRLGYIHQTLKPLQNIERKANRMATRECNEDYSEKKSMKYWQKIEKETLALFTKPLPNFFINHDPRGYALKLKDGTGMIRYRDWGGYEILAPEF